MTASLTPYHDGRVLVWHGDCLLLMRNLPDASVDSVVTDPPYGLGFMGKAWDDLPPGEEWARECLRVLKPGGHLLAFGGSRTWHRLAAAVEDAGFEIRDSIAWLYGSGFPKSLDVSKAIDKAAGAERPVIGKHPAPAGNKAGGASLNMSVVGMPTEVDLTAPATTAAAAWQGWGTALKPAFEPVVVGRKPLVGTVAANVLTHGTGALNIDACRVAHASEADLAASLAKKPGRSDSVTSGVYGADRPQQRVNADGRWPTNVILDESQAAELDADTGVTKSRKGKPRGSKESGDGWGMTATGAEYDDTGGASRFFPVFKYQAKAPTKERPKVNGVAHPTVKPLALMQWLVRLVTPPGGLVLDPFAGSGTTGEACVREGFRCVLVEREADYLPLIAARLEQEAAS